MRWSVVAALHLITSLGMHLFFERVYTIDRWQSGPRAGAANFAGAPHFYRRLTPADEAWSPGEERFQLVPLSPELLEMILEADSLLRQWHPGPRTAEHAFPDGLGPAEARARYLQLERQIADGLAKRHPIAIMRGHFDFDPDRVRWTPIDHVRPHRNVSQN